MKKKVRKSSKKGKVRKSNKKRKPRLGLALGAGGARGLAHIGVLKVLHEAGLQPQLLAGTSMGAVIGALYASGKSVEEIEELVKKANWKEMLDFTVPKTGFIQGEIVERRLHQLLQGKQFFQLKIPLCVVSYNLKKKKTVVFSKGDVAKAVRASISIPGIFSPVRIGGGMFIDGAVANPTPFNIIQQMGADVVIAVDLFPSETAVAGPSVHASSFLQDIEKKFVEDELKQVKKLIFPEAWPPFLRRKLIWFFDKLLYPARVLRIMAGTELPPLGKVMLNTMHVLTNNLAHERLQNADVDIKVTPHFGGLSWENFDKAEKFIRIGGEAMKKELPKLRKLMGKN